MNDQVENSGVKSKKKAKMRTSDSDLDTTDDSSEHIAPKKVKFKIDEEAEEMQLKSKKRKVLASTDVDNTENMSAESKKKGRKHKPADSHRDDHSVIDDDGHEHHYEHHANDTIDWPQNDLRTLVKNIEHVLPEKDNLAFQTRADKLNWDDIAFGKYTGEDCKKTWFLIQKRIRRFRLLSELLHDAKEWISKPWTHFYRGTKNNRHPDMPKRPLSGYMLFYVKKKDKVLAQNPGLEMTEVSKRMAQMYKTIPAEKREKYMHLAAAEKKAYEEKLEEFYRLHPDIPRFSEKSNHSKAVETGPKKPKTPFGCYFNDQLNNFHLDNEMDRNTFKEQCKEQWKNMSDKKKVVWIDCALEEEDKYQEEVKNYMIQNPHYVCAPFKSTVTKEERAIKERIAGKPIKPPNSAYSLFSQIMLKSEEIKKIDPKGRMKALADQWKICSDEEKKVYQEHCEQLMAQYKLDFAAYLESLPESKRQEELQNNLPKRKKKIEESKNKAEEEKAKNDLEKSKQEEKKKIEEKIRVESHAEDSEKVEKEHKEKERGREREKEREKEKQKVVEKPKIVEKAKVEVEKDNTEVVETVSKKRKKKKEVANENSKEESQISKQVSLAKIFEAQPPHPPESGFALFSKRYHGKAPVKTAWKNLNKLEKKEYEAEVRMLKQKYIKDYEAFLKSLSKDQLTAFSQMNKGKNTSNKSEQQAKPESSSEDEDDDEDEEDEDDDDDDDEDYNTDNSEI